MGRFFSIESPLFNFLTKVADLILLNFLAMICCIPIITIGASMTALNYVALKMVRDEECYITRAFFKSFKENFKQATIIWIILLVGIAIIAGDIFIFTYSTLKFPAWLKIALMSVAIIGLFTIMHLFPVLAKFDNTIKNTFKNSLFMGILSFPKTVLMMVVWVLPLVLAAFFFQIFPIIFCLGISAPAYLSARLYNKTFKRFEPEETQITSDEEWSIVMEEEAETAEGEEKEIAEAVQVTEIEKTE